MFIGDIRVFFFAVFDLLIFCAAEGSHFRIVSGRKATTIEFPYQVDIEKLTFHWCGGSIIHERFVLTAAHCVKNYELLKPVPPYLLRVRVANDKTETGGQIYSIQEIIVHVDYNESHEMNHDDIALLKMTKPFKFNQRVKKVRLSSRRPAAGTLGWVSGFGYQDVMRVYGRHLMAVKLPVVDLTTCRNILPRVSNEMFCAGYKTGSRDSCRGDSGGPFVVKSELTGIVAWGIGCGREGLPGVYTSVAHYMHWILGHINSSLKKKASHDM